MAESQHTRTVMLLGEQQFSALQGAHVAVFGLGGVGSYVAEALARTGVGTLTVVDKDAVSTSNLNRQVIATGATVGLDKVDVMRERILSINPDCTVIAKKCFFLPETKGEFDFSQFDYVVDAVDTVTAKLLIIAAAKETGAPVISCMGTGNKLDPSQLAVADIEDTSIDPLARIIRKELRKRGISGVKVAYSTEPARKSLESGEEPDPGRRSIPASAVFVPASAGLLIASQVVRDITGC